MNAGNLVLVNFPFDDRPAYKKRPALVIAAIEDQRDPDLIVLQVTSSAERLRNPLSGDIVTSDPVLHMRSVVRCRKIFTLRESSVVRVLGTVESELLNCARRTVTRLIST